METGIKRRIGRRGRNPPGTREAGATTQSLRRTDTCT